MEVLVGSREKGRRRLTLRQLLLNFVEVGL